ncbi:MAG: ribonuclease E inhibitor RraB [Candidatus Limnocylindria bacterium]
MTLREYQTVTHFVYANSKEASERVATALKRHGFAVEVRESESPDWAITAVHSLPASAEIDSAEELVSRLASEVGATYDGYERGRTIGVAPAGNEQRH